MNAKVILILILLCCVSALAQTGKRNVMPQVRAFGVVDVRRVSDNRDAYGRLLPPWKEIKIASAVGGRQKPVVGEKVTIIPLDTDIASLELRIIKVEWKDDACDDRQPGVWEIVMEPVTQREFFDAAPWPNRAQEFPFDVCVIYPVVKSARQIKRNQLTKNMLPKGVAINTVTGAIDLTSDRIPDLLIVEYCCGNPTRESGVNCDYTCGKKFKRSGKVWKLIDTSAPC